jgi:hypothetical protein
MTTMTLDKEIGVETIIIIDFICHLLTIIMLFHIFIYIYIHIQVCDDNNDLRQGDRCRNT